MSYGILLIGFLLILIFGYIGLVLKHFWIDKNSVSIGTQFAANKMLSNWMTED
jgi:hypothetical protein